MHSCFLEARPEEVVALTPVSVSTMEKWLTSQSQWTRNWAEANAFKGVPGSFCTVPDANGELGSVLIGVDNPDPWCLAGLPAALPNRDYFLDTNWNEPDLTRAVMGWGLGTYQFTRYKKSAKTMAKLVLPSGCNRDLIDALISAVGLTRDLINTPAEDMMPEQLAQAVEALAATYGAKV